MHEIGCSLETLACTRRLRCVRQGPFVISHSLLEKYFQLPSILKNIQMCNKIFKNTMARNPDVIEVICIKF